jgi:hypothetical protein
MAACEKHSRALKTTPVPFFVVRPFFRGRLFKQAAERSSSLVDAAERRSLRWFQGKAAARTAFV